jgi:PAS domain S-box-containing protein
MRGGPLSTPDESPGMLARALCPPVGGGWVNLRILLVEDDPNDADLLLRRLREAGIEPQWRRVASAERLREALASEPWQVALVDFNLPGFSGPEAIGLLAELAPDTPAITVSGAISEETAVATITAGAVDYVLKGNLTRLAPAVQRAVESAELRRMQRNAAEQAWQSQFAVEHASQAIVYVSEDAVILYANQAAGRLAGVAPEAAIGEGIWGWYPHLSREDWSGLWHAATEGPVEDVDATLRRADGSQRAVSVTIDHVKRDEGDFVIAYARDVTESKRAQADLSFTEFVVEHAGDSVFWMEAEGAFKYANPAACEALGYTLDELRTMSIRDIDPKYSSQWAQHINELREAGALTFETQHRRKDGTLVPVEVTAAYLEYDGAAYDVGFARDITERKRAEEALAASEKRFRGYFEQSLIGAAVTSPGKGIVDVNPAFLELIGYSREELEEKSWAELTHPDDVAADVAQFERVLAGEIDGYRLEKRFIRKDGEAVHVDMSVRVIRDDDGAVEYFLALITDVTDRKRAEEALAHSRDLLDYVVAHASSAIAIHDRDLNYIYVSQRYLDEYGIEEQNIIGRHHYDVLPDLPQKWRDVHQRALAGEVCGADRDPYERADGSVDWTRWECRPWYEADGTVGGIIVYTEVITDRVLAEEALRESERRFTAFATYMPGRLWIRDSDLRYLYVNPQLSADLGGSESDFLGRTPEDLWDEATAAGARAMCQRAVDGEVVDVTERWPDRAGSGFYRSLVFSLAGGEGAGMLGGLMFDVTEQHAAQEEVRRRVEQLDHIVEGSVLAMSQIVETRDPYTAGHERRVAELAVAIGAEMGLGGPKLDGLRFASLIHDIGKISVPAEILSKPGRLSPVEFSLIKQHSQAGHDILATIEFQQPVALIVVQHHERLDGSGYPQGLSGEEIMQEARILAVADVVEAMSSHRPYRAALGMEAALAEVREHAGVTYDADIVAACVRLVEEKSFAFTR